MKAKDVKAWMMGIEGYEHCGVAHWLYQKLAYVQRSALNQPDRPPSDPRRLVSIVERVKRDRHLDSYGPILIGAGGRLADGAHRIACAMYYGVDSVPVAYTDHDGGMESWAALTRQFTEAELALVVEKRKELYERFCGTAAKAAGT